MCCLNKVHMINSGFYFQFMANKYPVIQEITHIFTFFFHKSGKCI